MMTFEEFEAAVGEVSLEIPDELFDKLNGGIAVKPEAKLHAMSQPRRPLYIAGEYSRSQTMWLILVYYGSFVRLYGRLSDDEVRQKISGVLRHELRHHWESLSGERGLEIEDEENIYAYLAEAEELPGPDTVYWER